MKYTIENLELIKQSIIKCGEMLDHLPDVVDGGTCNLDSVAINFTGWPISKVRQIPLVSEKLTSRWWKGYCFINFSTNGQANNRSHRVEVANKFLRECGVESIVYYQID